MFSLLSITIMNQLLTRQCTGTGKQLAVRPVLDPEAPDTHSWSLGASDGDHNIRLDAMDEGLTRLVASLPTDEAEAKGTSPTCFCICWCACWCSLAVTVSLPLFTLGCRRSAAKQLFSLIMQWASVARRACSGSC